MRPRTAMKPGWFICFIIATLTMGMRPICAQIHGGLEVVTTDVLLLTFDFSSDGSMCVAGGDCIRIFDTKTGKLLHKVASDKLVRTARFSPGARDLFATTDDEGMIRIWRVGEKDPLKILGSPGGRISGMAFSPDGSLIAEGRYPTERSDGAGTFRLWEVATGEITLSHELEESYAIGISFSADGNLVAYSRISADENTPPGIEVYNHEMWHHVRSIAYTPGHANAVSISPDSCRILIAGMEVVPSGGIARQMGRLWLASLDSDEPARRLTPLDGPWIKTVAFSPGGNEYVIGTASLRHGYLVNGKRSTASVVAQVQMRDLDSGEVRWSQDGEIGYPHDVTFSRDGRLVGCCTGEKVLILDAKTGERRHSIAVDEE